MAFSSLFRTRARFAAFLAATAILAGLLPSAAKAYDEDTHFYATYAMARYAGIKHEVAARIATTAEWMDESNLSDPTSYIFLPVTGIKKRRLLHFPSSRVVGSFANETQQNILGLDKVSGIEQIFGQRVISFYGFKGSIDIVNFMTETTEDNAFASELFMQGLKEGNLMKSAASLHVLEDSFAHAGTPAEQGHALFWHWPDRPFAATDKYFRMVSKVFMAMTAIRSQLPPEALDCNLHLAAVPDSRPNCEMDAATLARNYSSTDAVVRTVTADTLRDPEYIQTAMRDFLERAVKSNYVKITPAEINQILASLPKDGKLDGYATAELVMKQLIAKQMHSDRQVVDFKFVLTDMGRVRDDASSQDIKDYIDSLGGDSANLEQDVQGGVTNLVHVMAEQLLKWQVPQPLSDHHRMEFEDDSSPIRKKEMELRIRYARQMIRQLFGTDIEFVTSNSKDSVGLYHEVMMNPIAEPSLPKGNGSTYYATFSLREKNLFDIMVFKYLFPDLDQNDLYSIVKQGGKATVAMEAFTHHSAEAKRIEADKSLNFFQKYWAKLQNDRKLSAASSEQGIEFLWTSYKKLRNVIPKFLSDLVNKYLKPSPDNFYYRNTRLFDQYRKNGIVKPFFTQSDVWKLQDLKSEADAQSNKRSN